VAYLLDLAISALTAQPGSSLESLKSVLKDTLTKLDLPERQVEEKPEASAAPA